MAISVTGRVVKAKRSDKLRRMRVKEGESSALKYNHIRVQFADGSCRHMLFTDKQLERARQRAREKLNGDPDMTWFHELWFEDCLTFDKQEVQDVIDEHGLPKIAKKFNHVRVNCDGRDMRFLFTDSEVRSALVRAMGGLPKISWLTTTFK